jgi:hypothetical protein
MDDFLSKRLSTKKEEKTVDSHHMEEEEEQFEISSTITHTTIENLKNELKNSNQKYRILQKEFIKTKEALERHAMLLSNFKNWVDMLDLMLNEGKDTVRLLKDQVEELLKIEDQEKD